MTGVNFGFDINIWGSQILSLQKWVILADPGGR